MQPRWKRISTRSVYRSEYVSVLEDEVQFSPGKIIRYARIEIPDSAAVIPIDDQGAIVMIWNYRYPAKKKFLEVPAGHIEEHESPEDAARRELAEETGFVARRLVELGWYYPSTRSNQKAFVFLAKHLKAGKISRDATENQMVVKVPRERALKMLRGGGIRSAHTIAALALAMPILLDRHST